MKTMNVAIIGTKFMGKAHSNAWANAPRFFDMGIRPVLKVAVGTDPDGTKALADTWGWEEWSTDWREVVARPDIDIVDIATPTFLHHEMAMAAAENGKHIFLEKPFSLTVDQAREMLAAAKKAGDTASVPAIETILAEEREMADWLIRHIPQTTEQFLLRSDASGVEAKK